MKRLIILSFAIFLITSCSSNSETSTEGQNNDSLQSETTQQTVAIAYDTEWNRFKNTIVNNDSIAFLTFVGPDVTDPEWLFTMLKEDWVLEDLTAATYADLTISDYNGIPVKEFSAGVEGSDEEGNIYESGIYLYFEESADGFVLVNVLMAG